MERQARFLRMHIHLLSEHYLTLDTSRLTALYFCLVGLDLLNQQLDQSIVDWIYARQVSGGFSGATSNAHIAMTFSALASLATLGDDMSRVDKPAIAREVRKLQNEDGSVAASIHEPQRDVRFVYCACAISKLIGLDTIDNDRAMDFVMRCQAYDGGFGLTPGGESHGGSTFCCVAALVLNGRQPPHSVSRWCVRRLTRTGFEGRRNKPPDSCYAFWIGACLRMLGEDHDDLASVVSFVHSCEHVTFGGFAKFPDSHPDLLHTFYSLASLSWVYQHGVARRLEPIHPALAIRQTRAVAYVS